MLDAGGMILSTCNDVRFRVVGRWHASGFRSLDPEREGVASSWIDRATCILGACYKPSATMGLRLPSTAAVDLSKIATHRADSIRSYTILGLPIAISPIASIAYALTSALPRPALLELTLRAIAEPQCLLLRRTRSVAKDLQRLAGWLGRMWGFRPALPDEQRHDADRYRG